MTKGSDPDTDIMEKTSTRYDSHKSNKMGRVGTEIMETKISVGVFPCTSVLCVHLVRVHALYACACVEAEVNIGIFVDHPVPYFLRQVSNCLLIQLG